MNRWIEVQPVPGSSGRLVRPEPFGGTLAFRRPEMLVMVDKEFLRAYASGWAGDQSGKTDCDSTAIIPSAPFEAHLTISHRCSSGCQGCYISASPDAQDEMGLAEWKEVLSKLARLGVYHVALGAGEDMSFEPLIELAKYARRIGMTPNLSTAGTNLTPKVAEKLNVFGRVHLSMDGVAESFSRVRGHNGYAASLMSLKILRAFHKRVGVNCVVARSNYDELGDLFRLLQRNGIRSVELLRFKPSGRGAKIFDQMNLTEAQERSIVGHVLKLSRKYRMRLRLDCSFTPMVCAEGIDPRRLVSMGLAGCIGGSWLVSIDGRGRLSSCSFDNSEKQLSWQDLGRPGIMDHYTNWTEQAPEPCATCRWLDVCRGGCHVVARHVTGDFNAPDPGCPLVSQPAG
ncbi:MAG: radical SAM protein [Deltaproteobacteria bacterium]|nr:radical SAM protein [Deltaproteobacteria bacterium]